MQIKGLFRVLDELFDSKKLDLRKIRLGSVFIQKSEFNYQ